MIVTTAASFAFFTYSRVGNTTSTVISGNIEFSYIEGESASLTNAFPVKDSIGAIDESGEYEFEVGLKSSGAITANYNVYLIDNNEGTNHFTNDQIKFALIKNDVFVANTSATEGVKLSTLDGFNEGVSTGEGLVLNDQEITSGTTDYYKLRIWISDDVNYTNEITSDGMMSGKYNGYTYSLKVKVTSNSSASTTTINDMSVEYGLITATLEDKAGLSAYAVMESGETPTDEDWIEITSDSAKSNVKRISNSLVTKKTITFQVEETGTYYLYVKNVKGNIYNQKIDVDSVTYKEALLNGTDPVLTENLVPVIIDETGKVTKAATYNKWYNYENSVWANAVVLKTATTYTEGQEIPEEDIESYFVWIPKYSYQLWDLGNYTSLTSNGSKQQEIKIKFGTSDTSDSVSGECTTPGTAGGSGNCSVGDYMTHPAFLAFDTTGLWVGKFKTGYDGATATDKAQVSSTDISKIIIKPNVYSWRNNTVGNFFKLGYDYLRSDESHMMKNTEWGAVAYLQHSKYGSMTSVRINNNNKYITGYAGTEEPTLGYNGGTSIAGNRVEGTSLGTDGTYTVNYLNTASTVASTTGNYSGIYDMSGGCWEYVMGYTTGASTTGGSSGITSLYSDFYTNSEWNKYYDKYSSTATTNYSNRILGDATGEMGPFFSETDPDSNTRYKNSWYKDYANFAHSANPWFERGGNWNHGTDSGSFAFHYYTGAVGSNIGFRVVLAPSTAGA